VKHGKEFDVDEDQMNDHFASKRIFATIKSTIDAVKFSNTIQLSPF